MFYEEMACAFRQFPKYRMEILLGDLIAKAVRGDIFKLTIGNESSHEISNDNGVRIVNFVPPHHTVYKYTEMPRDGNTHNQIDRVSIYERRQSNISVVRTFRGAESDADRCMVDTTIKYLETTFPKKLTAH